MLHKLEAACDVDGCGTKIVKVLDADTVEEALNIVEWGLDPFDPERCYCPYHREFFITKKPLAAC
jgi:hypothetical protein